MPECAFYLDALRSTRMPASNWLLTVRDRYNVLRDSDMGAWVKHWWHCCRCGMYVLGGIGSEIDCAFVQFEEQVQCEKDLPTLSQRFDGRLLPKLGLAPVVLRLPASNLYFTDCFDYWALNCSFELRFRHHAGMVFAGCHNIEFLPVSQLHCQSHYIRTPGWWQALGGSCLPPCPRPPDFSYYSGFILKHHARHDLVLRIATSKFVVYTFFSFLRLTWAGISVSARGDSHVLGVKKGILFSFPWRLLYNVEKYSLVELLCDDGFVMSLGFHAQSWSQ